MPEKKEFRPQDFTELQLKITENYEFLTTETNKIASRTDEMEPKSTCLRPGAISS